MVRVMKSVSWGIIALLLQNCAYSGKFNCADSKGANCIMLSRVDRMIDSGEIEKYHESKNSRKCLFGRCFNNGSKDLIVEKPPLASTGMIKAKIDKGDEELEYIEGEYLYVK